MGSGAVIYVPSFIKICSGVQKLIGDKRDTHTQTATWSHKPTLFFQNKESGLKMCSFVFSVVGLLYFDKTIVGRKMEKIERINGILCVTQCFPIATIPIILRSFHQNYYYNFD
jgi:hypothetical protein